ncbi:MAG TPA: ABC transporter substrate-binding protein, partial [Dehalococcoidales bacterium]|nr:ABC transporter substrate-binding protein [Dehalococcoidales bacterium]
KPSTTSPATSAPTTTATSAPTPTPTTAIKTGGILKIGTGVDATVLGDPPAQTTVQDFVTSKTCVESLGRYDAKGNMLPWLADNWKMDAAARTITVTLKKGITFHDGTPFNAAAVKWNIDRFLAAKRAELPAGTTVSVLDDQTVVLTLPVWDTSAVIGMGYFAGPQISPTAFQKAGDNDKDRAAWSALNPVGTGPFMFVSWQKTVKQVYKKNPNYWIKGQPYLDGIEWQFFADNTVMEAAYLSKEIDMIYILPALSAKNLQAQKANIVTLNTGLGLQMTSVWYNSAIPTSPFANLKVRQAVSHAINAKSLVDNLLYGFAVPLNQWAMPTSIYFNPAVTGYPTDADKAKQLLAEGGFPSGFKTSMLVLNTPDSVAIATAIQAMLAKAGIIVVLDVADNARYRQLTSPGGSFTAMCLASQRGEVDPALFWPRNLSASGIIMNKTIINPPEIEKGLLDAKAAPDQATKQQIVWNLQKVIFMDFCIFTPLYIPSGICAKQTYIKDDNIMTTEYTQWTPESAWLSK